MRTRRSGPLDKLTRRQREIAELIADGWSNEGISKRLFIERDSVKHHVWMINDRLGITYRDGSYDSRTYLASMIWQERTNRHSATASMQ